jgi:Flp pilus assembly pilin Flp
MTQLMNHFRRMARKTSIVKDQRGLSTVEYVIILVLIAAAAVGTWSTFGKLIMAKIGNANTEINDNVVFTNNGSNGATKSDK